MRARNGQGGAAVAISLALILAACGGGEDGAGNDDRDSPARASAEAFPNANAADVEVITAWADALRAGDVAEASSYFAVPSVAQNGIAFDLDTAEDVEAFNESLPCGGRVINAETEGDFTTATFRLTERPGRGACGDGVGGTAQTSFLIEDGKIAEWRRVGIGGEQPPGQTT